MAWLFHLDTVENWAYMDNVFSPEECDKIKRIALAKGKENGTVMGDGKKGKIDPKIRKNSVVWLNERDKDLSWMYQRLASTAMNLNEQFFKFDLFGFCEDMQFTEYKAPGEFYSEHMDKVYNGISRKLSIVVQLTDPEEYEGCELKLNTGGEHIVIRKNQGSVFAFPSYIMHQVTPITKGTRHSLVSWIAGKNFK
jgi:PKHD-type hydroxylase